MDCQWGTWESWPSCSDSCGDRDGTGNRNRTREVATGAENGGTACEEADGSDTQSCSVQCPGEFGKVAINLLIKINKNV